MKEFRRVLYEQKNLYIDLLFMFLLLLVCFYFYHLPVSAVLYPTGLCMLFLISRSFCTCLKEKKRCSRIMEYKNFEDLALRTLPESQTLLEERYQELIQKLVIEEAALSSLNERRFQEMMDYYTTWVHQIKTPIASMKLTLEGEDTPSARKMKGELFRIEQYVEMVLTYLRLDSESTDYVLGKYKLNEILRSSVRRFSGEFIRRKLSFQLEPMELEVLTDEKWLAFVVEQILSNALKYTKQGGIRICQTAQDTICVEDTGIGIAKEDLPRVFEKGFTGLMGREQKQASGLGMYLCRRICENLGHTIWIESEIGQGTKVYLKFQTRAMETE